MAMFKSDDPNAEKKMRSMLGPGQVDHQLRQVIQMCWMMLPENKKTVDELEKQIDRLLKRALKDLREDAKAFLTD
jgi:hypothetical protein